MKAYQQAALVSQASEQVCSSVHPGASHSTVCFASSTSAGLGEVPTSPSQQWREARQHISMSAPKKLLYSDFAAGSTADGYAMK